METWGVKFSDTEFCEIHSCLILGQQVILTSFMATVDTTVFFHILTMHNNLLIFHSFLSALHLRVSFGLLNNLPPFFSLPSLTVWFVNNLVLMV
jgi:hypothetical protein